MGTKVQKIPGELPSGWQKNVVFFANLLSLFYGNEEETDILRETVGALETYGSRLVPLINIVFRGSSKNTLVLEKDPDDALLSYFKEDLGLLLPDIKILSHEDYLTIDHNWKHQKKEVNSLLDELTNLDAKWVDGYVTDAQLTRIAEIIGKKTVSTIQGSHNGNNKLLLQEHIEEKGLPVFDTFIVDNLGDTYDTLKRLKGRGYSYAVIKAAVGASGIGLKKIDLHDADIDVPQYLFYEGSCLVQGWLDETFDGIHYIGSPSVQMFIGDEKIELHDITEQILSKDSIHEGNIAPPPFLKNDGLKDEILTQAQVGGQWLYDQGYRGTASADFHLVKRKGKVEVRICEINARVTGATYPSMLARHFKGSCVWLMRNIRFAPARESDKLLQILKEREILYVPGKDEGVLPFNFNPNEEGGIVKGQFLFIGQTHNAVNCLLKKISEEREVQGVYDRD